MMMPLRTEAEVDRLVTDNRKLVEYMVNRYLKRFYVGSMERDDLVSWGLMGLVNAARAWDPARRASFSTLACRAIERMIIRGVNREWRPEREQATVSLDQLISGQHGEGEDRFVDQLPADEDIERRMLATEREVAVKSAISRLSDEQQELLHRHYYEQETVQDIARRLGLSRQGVYSREKAIFRQLRAELEDGAAMAA